MPIIPGLNDKQMLTAVWQLFKITVPGLLHTAEWLALRVAAWSQTLSNFLAQCPG